MHKVVFTTPNGTVIPNDEIRNYDGAKNVVLVEMDLESPENKRWGEERVKKIAEKFHKKA